MSPASLSRPSLAFVLLALVSINASASEPSAENRPLQLKLGMRLHVDIRSPLLGDSSASASHSVQLIARRTQLQLSTTFLQTIDSDFIVDFLGGGERTRVEHAFLNFRPRRWLQAQIGLGKVPMGHEFFAVSSNALDFIERSLLFTNINPQYELGAALHGALWDDRVEYWAGYNINPPDSKKHHDAVARLAFMPVQGVSVGASGFWGQRDDADELQWKLATGYKLMEKPISIKGAYWGLGGELAAYHGPASFKAEYGVRLETPEEGQGALRTQGLYASASWVLTGERKTVKGVEPREPLDLLENQQGLGAWELAARYGRLWGDAAPEDGARSPRVQEFSLGLNWYLTSHVRWMLGLNMYRTEDVPAASKANLLEVLARAQLAF